MRVIDKEKPVLVTGATGYVAGWIVKKLLNEGLTVHATVRDPHNTDKLKYLQNIAAQAPGTLKFFKADLLEAGSFDEAMKDCELVFHTASPFINKVKDPQRDLVDPALIGTKNVLDAVNRTASVQRVVLTSSSVAIIGDAIDCESFPNGLATEAYWNTTSSVTHQPYNYSKVVAERAAWEINKKQDRWDLVTINPSLVIGPGLNAFATSESFNIVRQIGDGSMKFGIPEFYIGVVDVRDVAEVHFKAGFTPQAKGRYITSAENTGLLPLANILKKKYGTAYPFPSRYLPKPLVWLLAPLAGFKRKMISRNVGHEWKVDNSKSIQELGVHYRPIEESITEMFQQLADNGIV
ncbi:NAD-dependent epimerase/dehydratase family protein [Cytophaga aurantiaca]|uniref:NAD-dependent epimerase/dehydratase family protein n=1 Tax=Cytophaga aurantiaca TaxID=29530 RepID=UPI000381EC95|nr:NAD-dependent epimerase/dehydratase family protein [Cytophaga aurantiaca]